MTLRRPLAIGAALAIALGGLAIASPALADDAIDASRTIDNPQTDDGAPEQTGGEDSAQEQSGGSSGDATREQNEAGPETEKEASGAAPSAESAEPLSRVRAAEAPEAPAVPTVDGFEGWASQLRTAPLTSLSGTGEPGALLEISLMLVPASEIMNPAGELESAEYSVTVGDDGRWRLTLDQPAERGLMIGSLRQSEIAMPDINFSALLLDPIRVTSLQNGASFTPQKAPSRISGTVDPLLPLLLNGPPVETAPLRAAEIAAGAGDLLAAASDEQPLSLVATLAGESYGLAFDQDGNWSLDLGSALPVGDYTLKVALSAADPEFQRHNRTSVTSVRFSVEDPAVPVPGDDPDEDDGTEVVPVVDRGSDPVRGGAVLASTGSDAAPVTLIGALALASAGAATLMLSRRKRA